MHSRGKEFFDLFKLDRIKEVAAEVSFGLNRMQKEWDLHSLSFYDIVTGLPNKASLDEELPPVLRRAERGCFMLVGIERLEELATAFGPASTETVLKQASRRLQEAIEKPR